ncbi:hypothetical protein LIER_28874 [Lithospermum erythrorhizon]|uniref:Integrase zinc-binding domain-containing protein n=1 Tax=Lithospermum erythrorhizon TaxID=34254 RepID=A0AAV3RKS6_LITER
MHGGMYGSHINSMALTQRILQSGIFWPSVAKDAQDHVRKYDSCQRHASILHLPPHEMISMLCPIPFRGHPGARGAGHRQWDTIHGREDCKPMLGTVYRTADDFRIIPPG